MLPKQRTMPAQMSFADFLHSTETGATPPPRLSRALLALWHDKRGDWDAAHTLAQEAGEEDGGESLAGAWVHAYLHRREGDAANAAYWYRRAGRSVAPGDLEAEWEKIVRALLRKL